MECLVKRSVGEEVNGVVGANWGART